MSLLDNPSPASQPAPTPDPVNEPLPEQPDGTSDSASDAPSTSRRARVAVVALIVGLLALWAIDVYLVPSAARVRQQHWSDEFQVAKSKVRPGDPALLLQIPTLRLNEVVVKGATPGLLRGGPGWREGSASPGEGNTVVLGRSTRWAHSFNRLRDVPKGSSVFVQTRDGRVYTYRVSSIRTIDSGRISAMDPAGASRLTLITSAGGPFNTRRVVVVAKAIGAQPEVPKAFREPVRPLNNLGPFDERSAGGLLLLLSGFVVAGLGVLGILEMTGRYRTSTVVVVAGPALVLGVVLVLFNLDAFLPITY